MLAKQQLERHALPEEKWGHRTAFLSLPETQCYTEGGKKNRPKEYRKYKTSKQKWVLSFQIKKQKTKTKQKHKQAITKHS